MAVLTLKSQSCNVQYKTTFYAPSPVRPLGGSVPDGQRNFLSKRNQAIPDFYVFTILILMNKSGGNIFI